MPDPTPKRKRSPAELKELLSRDVHAILRVCVGHFDDVDQELEETCLDVDAIIAGRMPVSRPRPARELSELVARRGHFIPEARRHSSHLAEGVTVLVSEARRFRQRQGFGKQGQRQDFLR